MGKQLTRLRRELKASRPIHYTDVFKIVAFPQMNNAAEKKTYNPIVTKDSYVYQK